MGCRSCDCVTLCNTTLADWSEQCSCWPGRSKLPRCGRTVERLTCRGLGGGLYELGAQSYRCKELTSANNHVSLEGGALSFGWDLVLSLDCDPMWRAILCCVIS